MIVVGAGMAGLLAACMLRSECELLIERQEKLPQNHAALLRFPTSVVGDVLGIPFRKVPVMKTINPWRNPVADALSYAVKNTGVATLRSSIAARGEVEERYIAPEDLVTLMADRIQCELQLGQRLDLDVLRNPAKKIISTIPMHRLMRLLEWRPPLPTFAWRGGTVVRARLHDTDVYATVYEPDPDVDFSRVSITRDLLIIECPRKSISVLKLDYLVKSALRLFGLEDHTTYAIEGTSYQDCMKILPTDQDVRKRFIVWATDTHGVYSLGRFATWRPGLLLDDVVKDVRAIQSLIKHGNYSHRL